MSHEKKEQAREPWVDAAKWLPMGPHCVLATDLECHFIAVWDGTEWSNAWTDEPIDSVVTHWMELPDPPSEDEEEAIDCSLVSNRPNLVQAGDLWLMETEDAYHPDKMEYSLLIQCATAEQIRDAMKTGRIEFTIFAHYPRNEIAQTRAQKKSQ